MRAGLSGSQNKSKFFFVKGQDVRPRFLVLAIDESRPEALKLYYNLNSPTGDYLKGKSNLLFPFPNDLLDFKHESIALDKNGYLYASMIIEWNGAYLEPEVPFPLVCP